MPAAGALLSLDEYVVEWSELVLALLMSRHLLWFGGRRRWT